MANQTAPKIYRKTVINAMENVVCVKYLHVL